MEIKEVWQEAKKEELKFWHGWLDRFKGVDITKVTQFKELLEYDYLLRLVSEYGEPVKLLDAGSGPVCLLGCVFLGKKVEVTATDALADEYNKMCEERKIVRNVIPLQCEFMELDKKFEPETFDIVVVQNALDHSHDPIGGINAIMKILKKGGSLYMRHYKNVNSSAPEEKGMHLNNIDRSGDKLMVNGNSLEMPYEIWDDQLHASIRIKK